jgi:competence ComEA-like helix-hairpin-helix protein
MRLPLALTSSFHRRALLPWVFASVLLAAGTLAATKKPPPQPINLNAATSEELQLVPGIGPATAEKILTMRKSYGAFKSVDDLLAIRGIGKKRLDKMRKYLIAGRPIAAPKPSTASKPARSPAAATAASCPGCAKPAPQNEVSRPVKSVAKSTSSPNKPDETPAPSEANEEPQRR